MWSGAEKSADTEVDFPAYLGSTAIRNTVHCVSL